MECLSCVICKEKDAGKINPFTESTLNKCRIALKIRQEYKLKYCDVILPSEVSSNKEGYHRQCYANLTSIKKQYKQNLSAISLESPSTSDIPPRSDQVVEIEEIVQTVPELEDSALFLDNPPRDIPPRSDQVVEIEEIVQTVPELEDSALFLDNPPRGEQIIEEIEIVQTEPQLQLSVSHTDNENQPDNQDGLGPSPEPATAAPNASEKTDVCIFCSKARRKVKGQHALLYSIEKAALIDTLQLYKEFVENTTEFVSNFFGISFYIRYFLYIPPRSDQVVEIEEIVQTVPELEDSALFLDNPPRGEQIIEEIEIVQTEPQLQLSVSHTDNENQPDNQDDDERTSYNEDIFSSDDSAEEDSEDSSDEDEH
ncbi:hypothetical protein FQA39_LY18493 [Lamprigera yunnana]|nr:hypothetical protein FQA39_LY18493 [Lamprigera yunnana]